MRFARWSFALAGIYGLIATLALYFAAPLTAESLWLYGFAGAAAATQLAYLLIATDPVQYRLVMPIGIVSKLSFAIPATILYVGGALAASTFVFGLIDFALAALFLFNFLRVKP